MTYYAQSAYGTTNPHAGMPANGNCGAWGGYEWPNCPPSSLTSSTDYTTTQGQRLRVSLRTEIVELWNVLFELADTVHGYTIYAEQDGEAWGPWGGECRSTSGGSPSGHSMWLSVDINAPYNPMSYTWQCNIPPAMVTDFEQCGMYWGGRYVNQKTDPMHFGYCYTPADVAGHLDTARKLLGSSGGGNQGGFLMALNDQQQDQLYDWVKDLHNQLIPSGIAQGQKSVGSTIAAGLGQAQANANKLNQISGKIK